MSQLKRNSTLSSVVRDHRTGGTTSTITSSPVSLTLAKASTTPPFPGKRREHSAGSVAWILSPLSLNQSSGWWERTLTRWELSLSGLLDTSATGPSQNVAILTRESSQELWTVGFGREVVGDSLQPTQPGEAGAPTLGARRVPNRTTRRDEMEGQRRPALPSRTQHSMTFHAHLQGSSWSCSYHLD